MVPPYSDRISRVPPYSIHWLVFRIRGCHPLWPSFPACSAKRHQLNWAAPRSLAATCGISVDFFSSGYLDVSVLPVRFFNLCIQLKMTLRSGFPIRISWAITLVISLPKLFADFHVLLRLLSPRHPPCALIHLIIQPQVIFLAI